MRTRWLANARGGRCCRCCRGRGGRWCRCCRGRGGRCCRWCRCCRGRRGRCSSCCGRRGRGGRRGRCSCCWLESVVYRERIVYYKEVFLMRTFDGIFSMLLDSQYITHFSSLRYGKCSDNNTIYKYYNNMIL